MEVDTPAQAGECFFLDEAEELGLDSGWNIADFIQKERAARTLSDYNWPGNVRELRNALERAVVTCSGEILRKEDLGLEFGRTVMAGANDSLRLRPGMTVAEAERLLIHETLAFTENNKTRAAELLEISLKTLHNKLKEYEAEPQS